MKIRLLILICSILVVPHLLWAVDACDQDRPKVCGGITPGHSAVHDCMLANLGKLSPDCQNTVQSSEALLQQFIAQCKGDTRRFCSTQMDLRPNDVVDCMKAHKEEYSAECKRIYRKFKAYDYSILK